MTENLAPEIGTTDAPATASRLYVPNRRTAVYRLHDAGKRAIYIGATGKPRIRVMAHSCQKSWWPQVASVSVAWYPTREAALVAEAVAIRAMRPIYNLTAPDPARPSDYMFSVGYRGGFPAPAEVAAMGPVWVEADVKAFLAVPRRPGRRRLDRNEEQK